VLNKKIIEIQKVLVKRNEAHLTLADIQDKYRLLSRAEIINSLNDNIKTYRQLVQAGPEARIPVKFVDPGNDSGLLLSKNGALRLASQQIKAILKKDYNFLVGTMYPAFVVSHSLTREEAMTLAMDTTTTIIEDIIFKIRVKYEIDMDIKELLPDLQLSMNEMIEQLYADPALRLRYQQECSKLFATIEDDLCFMDDELLANPLESSSGN
jgi:hypothetical protein